jgi:cell division protein ZapA (FtsZ GTPase activity inhibitor)
MEKIELLKKLQQGMVNADIEAKNADTTGKKILAGLKLAGKAAGLELATVAGNVVDTTYKAGKVAVRATAHAPKVINGIVDKLDKEVDELVATGNVAGLDRAVTVAAATVTAYEDTKEMAGKATNWLKGKFQKAEAQAIEAEVVGATPVQHTRQAL